MPTTVPLFEANRDLAKYLDEKLEEAGYDSKSWVVRRARKKARSVVLDADEDSSGDVTADELDRQMESEFGRDRYAVAMSSMSSMGRPVNRGREIQYGSIGWIVIVAQIARLILNWLHDAGFLKADEPA